MRNSSKVFVAILALTIVSAVAVTALRAQNQNPQTRAQELYDLRHTPTTDYDRPEPSDPEKRKLRRVRGNRYGLQDKSIDASRFAISEQTQSSFGTFEMHAGPEPAIPAARSDAIVIGTIADAGAFLSTDRVNIYSEFTVKVGEVLKDSAPGNLYSGATLSAVRGGGAVRLPSGRVVRRGSQGKPLPRAGREYVFFLTWDKEGQDFTIFTAYELRGGRVFPLDGLYMSGDVVHQLAAHQTFSGKEEGAFLEEVRKAISLNLDMHKGVHER